MELSWVPNRLPIPRGMRPVWEGTNGTAKPISKYELFLAGSPSDARTQAILDAQEKSLIERSQRGDPGAFTALMQLYRERVVRLAMHMVGSAEDAQDLCQETFVRVFRALDSFDPKRPFAPWLYRIAHNVILDFLRRRKARPATAEPETAQPFEEAPDRQAVDPQQTMISEEMGREVRAAIQALPENYRSVVVLRYLDDLSYGEIAEAMDLTEANVMMRMSRARRMLRDKLKHLHAEGI